MIIASKDNEYMLKFTREEWEHLLSGGPVHRVTGWSAGYFRFEVKVEKIDDPFIGS